MLGKASEIKVVELPIREVNDWLEGWADIEVVDIKYAMTSGDYGYALIIYKEV